MATLFSIATKHKEKHEEKHEIDNEVTKKKIQSNYYTSKNISNDNKNTNKWIHTCNRKTCACCINMKFCNQFFTSTVTKRIYKIINHEHILTCNSKNIIYLITCNKCKIQYVGETIQMLKMRMNKHRSDIRSKIANTHISKHFKNRNNKLEHNCTNK